MQHTNSEATSKLKWMKREIKNDLKLEFRPEKSKNKQKVFLFHPSFCKLTCFFHFYKLLITAVERDQKGALHQGAL